MKEKKEETEVKPKAVVEMEENSDAGKAKRKIKEKKELDVKTANKRFVIKYIIFIVVIGLITIGAIYFSINQLNQNIEENEEEIIETAKKTAEDQKYAINSYSETYNENSLKIQYYAGNDQPVENTYGGEEYAQIEGLLDKDIENNINKRLKETAKKLKEGNRRTFTNVTANFGNVLSAIIYNEDEKRETINIDLSTGNDIKLEDVFVSSAPLNSLIMEGAYKSLAWDKLNAEYDESESPLGFLDMNKVDTSEYEDIALKAVNTFKEKGKDIKYYITTTRVTVYLTNQEMYSTLDISFLGHREDVAIYKRYLTNKSIYENDSIGAKDIIVFTDDIYDNEYVQNLIYEQDDNVFIEEAFVFFLKDKNENTEVVKKIKQFFTDKAKDDKQRIKSETSSRSGAFYLKQITLGKSENYYYAIIDEYQASCDATYFKDEAFKDYAKMKNGPSADVGLNGFTEYDKDEYPNLKIANYKTSELYFDLEGNIIGTTEAEAKSKINKSETVQEVEETHSETINTNTSTDENSNTTIDDNNTNTSENTNVIENISY